MTQIRALSLTTKQKKELMKCVRLEFGPSKTGLTNDGVTPDRRSSAGRELERKRQEEVNAKEHARNQIVITLADAQNFGNDKRLSKIKFGTFTMSESGEVFKNDQPIGKIQQSLLSIL